MSRRRPPPGPGRGPGLGAVLCPWFGGFTVLVLMTVAIRRAKAQFRKSLTLSLFQPRLRPAQTAWKGWSGRKSALKEGTATLIAVCGGCLAAAATSLAAAARPRAPRAVLSRRRSPIATRDHPHAGWPTPRTARRARKATARRGAGRGSCESDTSAMQARRCRWATTAGFVRIRETWLCGEQVIRRNERRFAAHSAPKCRCANEAAGAASVATA